jgi:NTP pyrophosphatase (non-canonical NTP hydrolase)
MSERLDRILASIPQPGPGEAPALREVVLAVEVRRLRAQWADLRAKVDAERKASATAAQRATLSSRHFHGGQEDAFGVVLLLMDEATAPATTLAAAKETTMDGLMLVLAEVQAWQAATFGDRSPPGARVTKLREEVEEVAEEVAMGAGASRERVAEELADVLFVAVDIARAFDITPADLADAVRAKLRRNRARTWAQAADGTFRGSKGGG